MAKTNNESEEKSSFNISDDILVADSPEEKEYTKPGESKDTGFTAHPIEEPPIGRPDIEGEEKKDLFGAAEEKKEPEKEELDQKQKKELAKQLSSTFVEGYDKLNDLVKNLLMFNEEKYELKALKGDFDLDVFKIRLFLNEDGSESMTVREFGHSVNNQLDKVFVVDDEFKENLNVLLAKYFEQKGIGITIGQKILIVLGEDVIRKTYLAIQIKGTMNQILNIAMEQLTELKRQGKSATQHADDVTIEAEEVDDDFLKSRKTETEAKESEKEEAEKKVRSKPKSKEKPRAKTIISSEKESTQGKSRGRPKKGSVPIPDDIKEPEEMEKPE